MTTLVMAPVRLTRFDHREAALLTWLSQAVQNLGDWRAALRQGLEPLLLRPRWEQRLLVMDPQAGDAGKVERVTVARDETWIGRGPDNHLVLPSDAIGHRHARIVRRDRNYFLEDLATTVGTWLNQQRVEPRHPLQIFHGDVIRIFPYTLRYQATAEWVPEGEVQMETARPRIVNFGEAGGVRGWLSYDLQVHPDCGPVRLSLDGEFVRRVIRSVTQLDDVRIVLPDDRTIVELLVLTVLAAVNRELRFPFAARLLDQPRIPANTRGVAVDLTLGLTGFTGGMQWFLPLETVESLQRLHTAAPAGGPEPVTPAAIQLSRAEMSIAGLEAVEVGDLLLLDGSPLVRFPGGRGWHARRLSPDNWDLELVESFEESRLLMDDDLQVATPPVDVDQLVARIDVLVGEVELTLPELRGLAPGSVLSLQRSVTDPVQLLVNGRGSGIGELVEVEGELAVRVTRWGRA